MYSLLDQRTTARRAVILLLAIQTTLLAYSAYVHSPTINEPGHLVAGLSYWKFGRFDVYNVNPPLVKMVAALPVIACGYEEDWSGFYTGLGARPELRMGEDFIAANGERSFLLFMLARWACIPFSWLGGIVCYLWARDLYGRPAGVIACAVWCFEPNILAHASLMSPDAHATSLGVAACYTFWRWLTKPTWTQTFVTGVVLGLAELSKTTFILFYPLWPIMWIVYRWADRAQMRLLDWGREAGMLTVRMAIGLSVLNWGYGFEGSFQQVGEYRFVSEMLTGRDVEPGPYASGSRGSPSEDGVPNRFSATIFEAIPVPLPYHYVTGIDIQQRDFEHYRRPSFLMGAWRDHGWWYFYIYACGVKTSLGLWVLACVILASHARRASRTRRLRKRDEFILLFPAVVVFVVVSSKTGFSEHFRYALPCFPFVFVWLSSILWIDFKALGRFNCGESNRLSRIAAFGSSVVAIGLIWFVTSSAWIYPHSLSYFNELAGGPLAGPQHLLGSNVDWGQDMRYLKWELAGNEEDTMTCLAYFGGFSPHSVAVRYPDPSTRFNEQYDGRRARLVASVNLLYGSPWHTYNQKHKRHAYPANNLEWIHSLPVADRIGYSIRIYEPHSLATP